jgi:hypothetical protein
MSSKGAPLSSNWPPGFRDTLAPSSSYLAGFVTGRVGCEGVVIFQLWGRWKITLCKGESVAHGQTVEALGYSFGSQLAQEITLFSMVAKLILRGLQHGLQPLD